MMDSMSRKVTASQLSRDAFVYVRQSTMRQVAENQESTRRQYALRERATALGWTPEQIAVVDCDLGLSGAETDREGFKTLVAEVGMGRVGIVLGLEVSRLARNSTDWHRLLEICALTETLILDEDGLYNPTDYNDRLLLGLKGTMSEAELHMLRVRLRGGLLAKARRGELRIGLPVGLVYDPLDRVVLHPDAQVRDTLHLFFRTFFRTGAACATVKYFSENNLPFPAPAKSNMTAQVVWGRLSLSRAVHILHNPRYAGAFVYGRRSSRKQPDGHYRTTRLPRDQWQVLLLDAHPRYITWEDYERIQEQLHSSALAYGLERRHGPPREGPALLQGLVLCGRCGARMSPRYHRRGGQLVPDYLCFARTLRYRDKPCQIIPGGGVDAAMGQLLVETMTPMTLDLTLAVQAELEARLEQTDRLRGQQVERAEHEVDHARVRYMEVDPMNRLVAASLEADWNEKLRALQEIRDRVERERAADRSTFDETAKERIRALAENFPAVWNDPTVPHRERKRIMALLVTDVTLTKEDGQITIGVRFRGGTTTTLCIPVPLNAWRKRQTHPKALARLEELLAAHTDGQAASKLNEEGFTTGAGVPFDLTSVRWLQHRWGIKSYRDHLRAAGYLSATEMAAKLGIGMTQACQWRRSGRLLATPYNERGYHLFHPIEQQPPSIQARVSGLEAGSADRRSATPVARGAV
jgi:DNA invertase Pin-like site-specific DNA recombinase